MTIAEFREALRKLTAAAFRRDGERGESFASIPALPGVDADLVLLAAIDELEQLRALTGRPAAGVMAPALQNAEFLTESMEGHATVVGIAAVRELGESCERSFQETCGFAWSVGQEIEVLRAENQRLTAEPRIAWPICAICKATASCFGVYEDSSQPAAFACSGCCGHGNEDGWCEPITEDLASNLLARFNASAGDAAKADALQDSAYLAGLRAGWNLGIAEDREGYSSAVAGRDGYLRALKPISPAQAKAEGQ